GYDRVGEGALATARRPRHADDPGRTGARTQLTQQLLAGEVLPLDERHGASQRAFVAALEPVHQAGRRAHSSAQRAARPMTRDSRAHSGSLPLLAPTSAANRSDSASRSDRSSRASAKASAFWATNGLT